MKNKVLLRRDRRGLGCAGAKALIKKAVNTTLKAEKIPVPCEVSVLLTDNGGIRALNREFRDVDSETDVLSFPSTEYEAGAFNPEIAEKNPKNGAVMLGDMALSLERAVEQGRQFGHGTRREIQYLTVHSVLHLLGYDHVDEADMKKHMRAREKEIMAEIEGVKEE
jgi:probable rRNA maturation factor